MRGCHIVGLVLLLATPLLAQAPAAAPSETLAPEQLDELLAPIALYPDPLIAIILPASTVPSEITLARRYLDNGGDPNGVDNQPWDDSVKALAHYPDLLKWMDDNLEWTRTLGQAFLVQQADVMASMQQLRAKAQAAGNLANTSQQQIEDDNGEIRIEPAQPDQIYVPEYDPEIVYDYPPDDYGPVIVFSVGWPVGPWLWFDCDWHHRRVWICPWDRDWHHRRVGDARIGRPWRINPYRPHVAARITARTEIPRPRRLSRPPAARPTGVVQHRVDGERRLSSGTIARPIEPPVIRGAPSRQPPTVSRPAPAPPSGNVFGDYRRGSVSREESSRGSESRQPEPSRVREAPPRFEAPPERVQRPPERREPPPQSRSAPESSRAEPRNAPPSAFDGMNNGGDARSSSGRGAGSRGR